MIGWLGFVRVLKTKTNLYHMTIYMSIYFQILVIFLKFYIIKGICIVADWFAEELISYIYLMF